MVELREIIASSGENTVEIDGKPVKWGGT